MINKEIDAGIVSNIPARDWEEKVRDQLRVEIITTLIKKKGYLDMDVVKIACGLQIEEPSPEDEKFSDFMYEIPPMYTEDESESSSMDSENTPPTRCAEESDSDTDKKGRRKIDRGKVMALHNAGWSNVKIAEEMGCSAWSVSMIIKEESQK